MLYNFIVQVTFHELTIMKSAATFSQATNVWYRVPYAYIQQRKKNCFHHSGVAFLAPLGLQSDD